MRDAAAAQRRGLRDSLRWLGGGSAGASVWEGPGVTAAIVPAVPERSIINSAVYDDAGALDAAYDGLADAYAAAGVVAWDVWAPDFDSHALELLRARGHTFDGEPAAMTLDLAGFESPRRGDLDWDGEATFDELGRINDLAYGHEERTESRRRSAEFPSTSPSGCTALGSGGETASVLATIDHEDDLGIYYVATAPPPRPAGPCRPVARGRPGRGPGARHARPRPSNRRRRASRSTPASGTSGTSALSLYERRG